MFLVMQTHIFFCSFSKYNSSVAVQCSIYSFLSLFPALFLHAMPIVNRFLVLENSVRTLFISYVRLFLAC